MCRNIRTLHNFEPPATSTEVQAAALQYVRKISGAAAPSQANAAAFEQAVAAVAEEPTQHLLDELVTVAPPKNREVEAAKAGPRRHPLRLTPHILQRLRASSTLCDDASRCAKSGRGHRAARWRAPASTPTGHIVPGPRVRLATVSAWRATSASPTCAATCSSSSRRTTCGPRRAAGGRALSAHGRRGAGSGPRLSPDGSRVAWTSWREAARRSSSPRSAAGRPGGSPGGATTPRACSGLDTAGEVLALTPAGEPLGRQSWACAVPPDGGAPRRRDHWVRCRTGAPLTAARPCSSGDHAP